MFHNDDDDDDDAIGVQVVYVDIIFFKTKFLYCVKSIWVYHINLAIHTAIHARIEHHLQCT